MIRKAKGDTVATYDEIAQWVHQQYGWKPRSCWIAHCKEIAGITIRQAPNRKLNETRLNPCPINKQEKIVSALVYFDMTDKLPQPPELFARDLYVRAKDNLDCFKMLITHANTEPREAEYYLASHTLELALKAFLATSGVSKNKLLGYGHKISKIFFRCKNEGLPNVAMLPKLVERFEEMNKKYDFRYPTGCILVYPKPPLTIKILDELLDVLGPIVKEGYEHAYWVSLETGPPPGHKFVWED